MNCSDVRRLLALDDLDATVDPDAMRAHLEGCARCRDEAPDVLWWLGGGRSDLSRGHDAVLRSGWPWRRVACAAAACLVGAVWLSDAFEPKAVVSPLPLDSAAATAPVMSDGPPLVGATDSSPPPVVATRRITRSPVVRHTVFTRNEGASFVTHVEQRAWRGNPRCLQRSLASPAPGVVPQGEN